MPISRWIIGEFLGTFLLVFFGCGSVATAVAMQAQVGLFQVAIVWGFGLTVAILVAGRLSGAHLNPAITIAMAVFRAFPKGRAIGYILVQFAGAFAAGLLILLIYGGAIERFERDNGIERGAPGSEASGMIFGEYYPNPGGAPLDEQDRESILAGHAFAAELVGTTLLAIVIFCVTDRSQNPLPEWLIPFIIGITLTVLISLFAPVSMGGFNPARDLAPRIVSSLSGWGSIPFTVNGFGWLTVYITGPIAGSLTGGLIYRLFLAK